MSQDEAAAQDDAVREGGAAPPFRYDARMANEVELRWQQRWAEEGTYHSANPVGPLREGFERVGRRPKFYALDMFPYPSGTGLHVGHPLGYIASDVFARHLRMLGHHVLHPFGYDAFGLPAEQYAINTGQHPRVTTEQNIANMRRQLRRLGLGHDERREIATTDVAYYRWTQWIFLRMFDSWVDERTGRARPVSDLIAEFESGERVTDDGRRWSDLDSLERRRHVDARRLAYISEELVNWCPTLGTVLANEEVTPDGRSDVGNHPVHRRPMRQWMMRITAMAQRLADDLDLVDWPDSIKQMQRNWIGASDGALLRLVAGPDLHVEVFTTRPDTLQGASFVLLAPEHPLLDRLVPDAWPVDTPADWTGVDAGELGRSSPRAAIQAYRDRAARNVSRPGGSVEDRTGVYTGRDVVNPATGERIPVFVGDYVLMSYGTGAVVGVPAHDQRDFEFAQRYGLPVRQVLQPSAEWLAEHSADPDTPADQWAQAFTGDGEYAPGGSPDLGGCAGKEEGIAVSTAWLQEHGAGTAVRTYRLRDWLFSRQRYWGEPFPIVFDEHGLPVALPDSMLPVELPDLVDFRPTAVDDDSTEPVPPLARASDWVGVVLDLGDGPRSYRRETNTMPQWAGSCWYYLRYLDPTNESAFVDPEVERYWMLPAGAQADEGGVDLYIGGVEHAVLHLLYTRFWHKVLFDLGHVSTREPFRRLYNQGYILADAFVDERGMYVAASEVVHGADGSWSHDGRPVSRRAGKMGKSLRNGVSPDEMYEQYGADTLRLYEMAMGPLDANRPWRTNDVVGVYRFLQRLWRCVVDEETGQVRVDDAALDEATLRRLHQVVAVVRQDYEQLRYNVAIARIIELTNFAVRVSRTRRIPRALAEPMVLMLAPLAPHITAELWQRLGHSGPLVDEPFPEADPALTTEDAVTLPVQVDNKVRFQIEVPRDAGEDEIRELLARTPDLDKHTGGRRIGRLVVVPNKIVNVVTAP